MTVVQEILFLAHRIPFPPDRGDKIRSHHLLKGLAKLGRVHVGTFAENAHDRAQEGELRAFASSHILIDRSKPLSFAGVEALIRGTPVSVSAFDNNRLRDWVARTLAERPIDTIFVFSGQMGQYVPDSFAGRVIIDLCDVDSAKFEQYAAGGNRVWLNRREGRLLSIRITTADRPGILGEISTLIGRLGGNILEVSHHRLFLNVPAKGTTLDVTMETHDPDHAGRILSALEQAGHSVRTLDLGESRI